MVVDRFEVLRFHHIGIDAPFGVEQRGDVPDHVFHKLRVVVCALGDELLVRALEQAIQLA